MDILITIGVVVGILSAVMVSLNVIKAVVLIISMAPIAFHSLSTGFLRNRQAYPGYFTCSRCSWARHQERRCTSATASP